MDLLHLLLIIIIRETEEKIITTEKETMITTDMTIIIEVTIVILIKKTHHQTKDTIITLEEIPEETTEIEDKNYQKKPSVVWMKKTKDNLKRFINK